MRRQSSSGAAAGAGSTWRSASGMCDPRARPRRVDGVCDNLSRTGTAVIGVRQGGVCLAKDWRGANGATKCPLRCWIFAQSETLGSALPDHPEGLNSAVRGSFIASGVSPERRVPGMAPRSASGATRSVTCDPADRVHAGLRCSVLARYVRLVRRGWKRRSARQLGPARAGRAIASRRLWASLAILVSIRLPEPDRGQQRSAAGPPGPETEQARSPAIPAGRRAPQDRRRSRLGSACGHG